ncbi:hypothetical protein [Wolbachia endosymbiont of Armadillidium arcangelii]|uniref:Uncharacterized protein n=1 Tax=Wolbachia endosymbiont of Armadillidium arcangelii TaxID=3158571 RepID=A0AAU7Q2R0_9RICK
MQPDFIIDKCESIKDRVISLRLTDESGTIDDVVEVHVDYRDEDIDIPNELNIALGYRETDVLPMGVYTVNEITVQSPPKTLLIKAHATNLRLSLKEKVSKEWHQIILIFTSHINLILKILFKYTNLNLYTLLLSINCSE